MTFQKRHFGLLALGASALAFSGCSTMNPTSMPSGYGHHHNTYKSPLPSPSTKITAEQRHYMDAAQAEQFRDAVYDLLERLTMRAGISPKPAYIAAPEPMTTFYSNIDNDLREGMRHIGYALSDITSGAYVFAYSARLLDPEATTISTGAPNVEMVLKVFDSVGENARMLTEDSGQYYIQGAEKLNVAPAVYRNLPTPEKILNQGSGFQQYRPSQSIAGFDTAPVPTTYTSSVSVAAPSYSTPLAAPSGYVSTVDPALQMPRVAPVMQSGGPDYATSIDSSVMTYDQPVVNGRPITTRARISKEMEYSRRARLF